MSLLVLALASAPGRGGEIAVIAHPSVVPERRSPVFVANLFLVPAASWSDGTPVVPFDLKGDHPLKAEFYRRAAGRTLSQVRSDRSRRIFSGAGGPPIELDSPEEVLRRVARTPGAVGYVPRDLLDGSVRVIGELP